MLTAYPALTARLTHSLQTAPRTLCVIDGCCGAGKTTLAAALSDAFGGAPVIHMDDFFLPFSLRTPERLAQPGGNVHHERFAQEVLAGLESGGGFSYRRFHCADGSFCPKHCPGGSPLIIIEGSYSLHPAFQPAWQRLGAVTVFLSVDEEEQLRRIARRSPEKLQAFVDKWIPLEKNYFQGYDIMQRAQLKLVSPALEEHP
jgi:uridine kinase